MQRKSQWKTSKSSKWSTKIQIKFKHLRIKRYSTLYQQWSGEENQLPCMFICFSAHKWCTCLFQCCWIIWSVYDNFVVNFTFLFSSLAIIDLLEHNNQCCDNVTHHYHLPKSVLTTKLFQNSQSFRIFPKIPNIPTKFPIFPVEIYCSQNSREFCIPKSWNWWKEDLTCDFSLINSFT